MLINHKHKFLFVHIQKTAGTSITDYLSRLDGCVRIARYIHKLIKLMSQIILTTSNSQ